MSTFVRKEKYSSSALFYIHFVLKSCVDYVENIICKKYYIHSTIKSRRNSLEHRHLKPHFNLANFVKHSNGVVK